MQLIVFSAVLLYLEQMNVKLRDDYLHGTNMETAISVILGTDGDCGIGG
jgi:hypothetical protein